MSSQPYVKRYSENNGIDKVRGMPRADGNAARLERMRRAIRNAHAIYGKGCACPLSESCTEAGTCLIAAERRLRHANRR